MNYCSTANTAWMDPETRAVYRKGRKIGEIARAIGHDTWTEHWFYGSLQDRVEFDRQLRIANL